MKFKRMKGINGASGSWLHTQCACGAFIKTDFHPQVGVELRVAFSRRTETSTNYLTHH